MCVTELLLGWQSQHIKDQLGMDKHVFLEFVRSSLLWPVPITLGMLTWQKMLPYSSTPWWPTIQQESWWMLPEKWWYNLNMNFPLSSCFPWLISVCLSDASIKSWNAVTSQHSTRLTLNSPPIYPSGSIYCQQSENYSILQRCIWSTGWHSYFSMPPFFWLIPLLQHKGGVSQNFLAATTFDMHFCYTLSGWEGSASDGVSFMMHVFMTWRSRWQVLPSRCRLSHLWCTSVQFCGCLVSPLGVGN